MNSRIRILTAVGCAAVAVASAGPGYEDGLATRTAARRRVSESIRRLRQAGMAAPTSASAPTDLQKAIEKIRRLRVGGQSLQRQTASPAPTRTQTQPAQAEAPPPAPRPAVLSADLLARLEKLPVEDTIDPIGLADSVLRAGFRDSAYVLYGNVLRSAGPETPKDWVLLQMANCARSRDPKAARRLYARLLAECPDSRWRPVAKVQHDLIEWFEANNPSALLTAATQPAGM